MRRPSDVVRLVGVAFRDRRTPRLNSGDVEPTRRNLLIGAAGLAAAPRVSRRAGDPFTLGVASGDPTPDGVVLWTRLASHPLAEDGHGGMPARDADVRWQLAEDERFTRIVRSGTVTARRSWAHSVHVE